jgi:hypothetical protein
MWKFLTLPDLELGPLGRPARSQYLYRVSYRCSLRIISSSVKCCTCGRLQKKVIRPVSRSECTANGSIYLDTPENLSYRSQKRRKLKLCSKMERGRIISNVRLDTICGGHGRWGEQIWHSPTFFVGWLGLWQICCVWVYWEERQLPWAQTGLSPFSDG